MLYIPSTIRTLLCIICLRRRRFVAWDALRTPFGKRARIHVLRVVISQQRTDGEDSNDVHDAVRVRSLQSVFEVLSFVF